MGFESGIHIFRQVSNLYDNYAMDFVFQGLCMGNLEFINTPFTLQEVSEKEKQKL